MRLKDLHETFGDDLKDPVFAAGYLEAALEEGMGAFLIALRDVVQAREGMGAVAEQAGLGRESLYKALSENGNPQFSTIQSVLKSAGFHLSIAPNA